MAHHKDDKVKHKTLRLVDVDVSHVSLVDRPANQTPFKAIKRDGTETEKGNDPMNHMIKTLFGSRDAMVTSVMADTAAKAEYVAKQLIDGDVTMTEQEGIHIARAVGAEPSADERVVHLGKAAGVAYTIANLKKELVLYDMEGENFDEAVQQEGFVPGLMIGMDALHTTIRNIAMADDTSSPDVFATKVDKALEDFSKYVNALVTSLPTKAFKFEKSLAVVAPNDLSVRTPVEGGFNTAMYDMIFGKPEAAVPGNTPDAGDAKDAAPADQTPADDPAVQASGTPADPSDASADPDKDAAPAGEGGATPASEATAVNDPPPANLQELPKGTPEAEPVDPAAVLAAAMEELTKTIGGKIAEAVKPLNDRLDKSDEALASLSKAMGTSVATTPDADDDNVVALSKGQPTPGGDDIPLMDTAYRSRRQG